MFKYYRKDAGYLDHWPVFLAGNIPKLANPFLTDDIAEADFITIQYPANQFYCENDDFFEEIKYLKNKNKNIKCLIFCKEEMLNGAKNLIVKFIKNQIFTNKEIFVLTSAINVDDNNLYIPFPNKFSIHLFLHINRYLASIEQLVGNEKCKKIICLSRNQNHYRDNFFKKIYRQSNSNLFNHDNLIKYHMLNRNNYLEFDLEITEMIKKIDSQKIHLNNDVSNERMFDINHQYYGELIPEYEKYYFAIVNESLVKDFELTKNNTFEYQISEKTLIPMLTKCIFFVISHPFYESYLNRIGIETFENDFGIFYDSDNIEGKTDSIIKLMNKLNNLSYEEIKKIYYSESVQNKLNKNFDLIVKWSDQNYAKNKFEEFLKNNI